MKLSWSKQYFTCPPKCGVFVAATKLSAPTVGSHRPSSVASSRGGRTIPSVGGQSGITPSNGRVTPSHLGRTTPSTTPAARSYSKEFYKSAAKTPTAFGRGKANGLEQKITNGSIASKYLYMTAEQLNSREPATGSASPSRLIPSPTRTSLGLGSPTRPLNSPYKTPKPGGRSSNVGVGMPVMTPSKGHPLSTPRARIPSAIAMPPPASPIGLSNSRSVSLNDGPLKDNSADPENSLLDLEMNGRALQEKISMLMGAKSTPSSAKRTSRPSSVSSVHSSSYTAELQAHIDRLQSRVDSLDYENKQLRDESANSNNGELSEVKSCVETLQAQRKETMARILELETQMKTSERSVNERNTRIESLERQLSQSAADSERQKVEADNRLKDLRAKLDDGESMVKNLKEAIEAKEGLENQNDVVLKAKNSEITLLESRLQKVSADWNQDKKELGAQVDELRLAGQVCQFLCSGKYFSSNCRKLSHYTKRD